MKRRTVRIARLCGQEYGWHGEGRYIHKYYLPLALKRQISPADIRALLIWALKEKGFSPWDGAIPARLPEVVITYRDVALARTVKGATVRRVLLAYRRYRRDCEAAPNPEEVRAGLALNQRLIALEKELVAEMFQITQALEFLRADENLGRRDLEIVAEVSFFLDDDHPLTDQDHPAHRDDLDGDASLITVATGCVGPISPDEVTEPDYFGLGDDNDHKDVPEDDGLNSVRHCALFHELYDHLHVPQKHLARIGRIHAEIQVATARMISWKAKR